MMSLRMKFRNVGGFIEKLKFSVLFLPHQLTCVAAKITATIAKRKSFIGTLIGKILL